MDVPDNRHMSWTALLFAGSTAWTARRASGLSAASLAGRSRRGAILKMNWLQNSLMPRIADDGDSARRRPA